MKEINWNPNKNQQLLLERGISFEDIEFAMKSGSLLDDIKHPNSKDYPHQRMFVIEIDRYVWLVPYVESDEEIFLKTAFRSRKATKQYLGSEI